MTFHFTHTSHFKIGIFEGMQHRNGRTKQQIYTLRKLSVSTYFFDLLQKNKTKGNDFCERGKIVLLKEKIYVQLQISKANDFHEYLICCKYSSDDFQSCDS